MSFNTWKTIKLGTGLKTTEDFRKALKNAGCAIDGWPSDMIEHRDFTVATKETTVELVNLTVSQLVYLKDRSATTGEVYGGAKLLGLEPCPAEVGPQLRLQYLNQPAGERLCIGMKPIWVDDVFPSIFELCHENNMLLLDYINDTDDWNPTNIFVFCQRK